MTICSQTYNSCLYAAPYIYIYLSCSKYQSIPFKNISVIVRKQNFNQILEEIISTKHTTVIILALCSTLHIYLLMFQKSSIPFKNIWVIVRKQNFNIIQGEIISTIHATVIILALCSTLYINIFIYVPSINQFHS